MFSVGSNGLIVGTLGSLQSVSLTVLGKKHWCLQAEQGSLPASGCELSMVPNADYRPRQVTQGKAQPENHYVTQYGLT